MAISGILISILVSMIAFRQFALPQSKADLSSEVVVQPPYLRLSKGSLNVVDGKKVVTVEVLANTNGLEVIGADVVVEFDPKVLSVRSEGVKSTDALAVFNVNSIDSSKVDFSLFSSLNRDEPLLQTNADQETPIATIDFDVLDESIPITPVQIRFTPDTLEDTNMILNQDPRPESPTDILRSVQGAILTL